MAGFAEDLKRIPMSQGLGTTLARAADYARAQQHGEVALEHLLLALTEDDDAIQVLSASHVDLSLLKADVSMFLGGFDSAADAGLAPVRLAVDLKRILEASAAAASRGRRQEINGAIVLAAIVGDGKSSAAHMLRAQGLTFEEAIKALQRALAAPAAPSAPAARPAATAAVPQDAEDVLANARARVQTRSAPGLPPLARDEPKPVAPAAELEIPATTVAEQPGSIPGLAAAPAPWPPEVRTSGSPVLDAAPAEHAAASNFDEIEAEIPAARQELLPPPVPAPAPVLAPVATLPPPLIAPSVAAAAATGAPMLDLPLVPPARPRAPRAVPQPGSRWPAPVSPAWKDTPTPPPLPLPLPMAEAPPPLPSFPGDPPPLPVERLRPEAELYHTPTPPVALPAAGEAAAAWPDAPPSSGPGGPAAAPYAEEAWPPAWPSEPTSEAGLVAADMPPPVPPPLPEDHYQPNWPHQEQPPEQPPPAAWSGEQEAAYQAGLHAAEALPRPARARRPLDGSITRAWAAGIPKRLRGGKSTPVQLVLPRDELWALLDGQSEDDQAALVASLTVQLRAVDGDVSVEPEGTETQWLPAVPTAPGGQGGLQNGLGESAAAQWRWAVTPINPGRHELVLSAFVRTGGADGAPVITPLQAQVVKVRAARPLGRGLVRFFGAVLVFAAGWVAATYGQSVWGPVVAEITKLMR